MSGGGSVPAPKATAETWVNVVNEIQKASLSTRLGIPMIYGIDAVHGHNNVYNATIFPHNVGLGVTRQVHVQVNWVLFWSFGKQFLLCLNSFNATALNLSGILNLSRRLEKPLPLKSEPQEFPTCLRRVLR